MAPPASELVKHGRRDDLAGQLEVAERRREAVRDDGQQRLRVAAADADDVQVRVVGTQRDARPQAAVVCEVAPFVADLRNGPELAVPQKREDVQHEFIRQLLDGFLKRETNGM